MEVFIVRDGGATKVPKEVAGMEEVAQLRGAGFEVEVPGEGDAPADEAAAPAAKAKAAKAKA